MAVDKPISSNVTALREVPPATIRDQVVSSLWANSRSKYFERSGHLPSIWTVRVTSDLYPMAGRHHRQVNWSMQAGATVTSPEELLRFFAQNDFAVTVQKSETIASALCGSQGLAGLYQSHRPTLTLTAPPGRGSHEGNRFPQLAQCFLDMVPRGLSVLFGEHDRNDALGDGRISWIW
jgi:hypothetical protein